MAFACTDRLVPVEPEIDDPDEGAKVTVEFSLPPETKGTMTHDPTIETIHVAVFNQAGVLKQYEKATLTNSGDLINGDNPSGNPKYSVEINMSAKPRILHFIADAPVDNMEDLIALGGTSGEDAILNALYTDGDETAYWQRVVLDKVDAYTYQGGVYNVPGGGSFGTAGGNSYQYTEAGQTITVYEGDYIKRNGHKILDGTGYFQSDYVKGKVANIPLIRNFAEITVGSTGSTNFTPKKFALVNVPTAGYVAPYDSKKGEFCSAYIGTDALTHTDVAASDYPGSLYGSIDTSMPTAFIDLSSTDKDAYMFERPVPNASQPATCILVAGTYSEDGALKDDDGNTWFKIEIADDSGTYFPIYRGISYNITIGAISGTKGYASAQDAYNNDPIGDISGSVTTASLEQINDGKGTTLWVEYVDYVATDSETKTLYYTMYYTNPSNGQITYLYDTINITAESVTHPNSSYKAILGTPSVDSGTFNSGTPDDTKTWKKATVTLAESGDATKHSILHIEGKTPASTGSKPMYREVHYRVMGTQHFQNGTNVLKGTSLASEAAGEETTLTIYLPNDLGMSMFPLVLRIEAENGNFTTSDGLPVESGPSLFNSSKNAFYFLKTIEYEDYYDVTTGNTTTAFTAKFKTTRDGTTTVAGTNASNFRVLDKIKTGRTTTYFDVAECYVSVGGPVFQLSSNSATVNSDVTSVSFSIRSTGDANTTWTLAKSNNITSLSQESGSGNATINVTIPENTDTENSQTYTVTASREGFDDQVFTITQKPYVNLVAVTRTISINNTTIGNNYTLNSNYSYNGEVAISFSGNDRARRDGYVRLGNSGHSMTIEANSITRIVITWTENNRASTGTSITSGGGSVGDSGTTTTWTNDSGADSVTLGFSRNNNNVRMSQVQVTYLHEAE